MLATRAKTSSSQGSCPTIWAFPLLHERAISLKLHQFSDYSSGAQRSSKNSPKTKTAFFGLSLNFSDFSSVWRGHHHFHHHHHQDHLVEGASTKATAFTRWWKGAPLRVLWWIRSGRISFTARLRKIFSSDSS